MFWKYLHKGGEEPTAPCKISVCSHKALWDICSSTCTYFLFDELCCLVVEDGPQAVSVCRGLRVQAEVERNEDGWQLIPEVLLILHSNREENRAGVCEKGQKAGRNDTLNPLLHFWRLLPHLSYLSSLNTYLVLRNGKLTDWNDAGNFSPQCFQWLAPPTVNSHWLTIPFLKTYIEKWTSSDRTFYIQLLYTVYTI